MLGTPAYMSPEQAEGNPVDARTDVFSFGSLLYEMVTGRRAFPGENQQAVFQSVLRAEPLPMRTGARAFFEIEPLIRKCLKKDPKQRLQSIGDARIVIEEVLVGKIPS